MAVVGIGVADVIVFVLVVLVIVAVVVVVAGVVVVAAEAWEVVSLCEPGIFSELSVGIKRLLLQVPFSRETFTATSITEDCTVVLAILVPHGIFATRTATFEIFIESDAANASSSVD